jgi:hypothetical protein
MSFTSFASKAVLVAGAAGLLASGGAAAASAAPAAAPKATARTAIYNGEGEALEVRGNPVVGWALFQNVPRIQTRGGAQAGVRYYDKMTLDFTQCHCNSHVVLQYRTVGSGKYIAGGWDAISGRFPGGLSPAQRDAYVTTSVTAGASAGRKTPVAPELVSKDGRFRIVWGVRPAGQFTIFSGPGVYLLGTRWASWTAAAARATGELWGVDAKRGDLGHASIVLSAPESHDGLVYYSALRIVGGMGVVPYWRWYWSGLDIGWSPVASEPG